MARAKNVPGQGGEILTIPRVVSRRWSPYAAILSQPGAAAFCAAGALARLPISMLMPGIVLLVEPVSSSYAIAAAVAGTQNVANAICSLPIARAVDRFGQARIVVISATMAAVGLVAFVFAVLRDAPTWTYFAAAVLVGATGMQPGSLVRARWSALLDDPAELHTAFALEAVLDEVCFMIGPVLVIVVCARVDPASGVLMAGAIALIGAIALAGQRRTEPPVAVTNQQRVSPRGLARGVPVLVGTFMAIGGIFGSTRVTIVAFTGSLQLQELAGVALALFAAASLVSGVIYGTRSSNASLYARYLTCLASLMVGTATFVLVQGSASLLIASTVAGIAVAPAITSGLLYVEALAPVESRTFHITAALICLPLGSACGLWLGGAAVDMLGTDWAFALPCLFASAGVLVAVLGRSSLQTPQSSP